MIGDHQHGCFGVRKGEQLTNFPVYFSIVLANCVFELITCDVEAMGRIHVVPKGVMDTIDTHLHHHEIVPILGGEEMSCELETLASHLVYIGENLWLIARTKVPDVEDVFSNYLLDLLSQLGWVGVIAVRIWRQEVAYQYSFKRTRWVRPWHANNNRTLAAARKNVPQSIFFNGERIRDHILIVGVVGSVSEPVYSKQPRAFR